MFSKEWLKQLRANLQMTQEQFATTFGISVSSLRNWEQGSRGPEPTTYLYLLTIEHYPANAAKIAKLAATTLPAVKKPVNHEKRRQVGLRERS